MKLRIATRGSEQAMRQSEHIASLLRQHGHEVELVLVSTQGDRDRTTPLHELGGRGIFTKEVQFAVLDGRADIAVHSAKDLPSSLPTHGLMLACVPERSDPRDALVGATLAQLPHGATVATGSVRRQSQLALLRPDLVFVNLRGNIPTRVARADDPDVDATLVAVAGVRWVGLEHRLAQVLDPDEMIPQVGQGALALECLDGAHDVADALRALEHQPSRRCVDAERAFLATLGGGCDVPVGAYATVESVSPDGPITVRAIIVDDRGARRGTITGTDSDIGRQLAGRLTAE
jgi:hydroxymethylbilane synthase